MWKVSRKTVILLSALSLSMTLTAMGVLFANQAELSFGEAQNYFKQAGDRIGDLKDSITDKILGDHDDDDNDNSESHKGGNDRPAPSLSDKFVNVSRPLVTDISAPILEDEKIDLSPESDPWLDQEYEPESIKPLVRATDSRRVRAALISLVRNEEVEEIVSTMKQVEEKFNGKFNYPWIFFNDVDFLPEFKEKTNAVASGQCSYVTIKPEDWEEPDWIDKDRAASANKIMEEVSHVQYATKVSYHRMCRWNSGIFFQNPALRDFDWYWRVEPKTQYFCEIDYDVFAYMEDNDKDYGFNINLYDSPQSVKSLWPATIDFFKEHPEYVHPNNSRGWLIQQNRDNHNMLTGGYSTCHFWSNFEIGRLDFFRSKEYTEYFDHLDRQGGFFYERWGDAPVHSIALALLTDKSRIHFFKDIGYNHIPYYNCHSSPKCSGCVPGRFADVKDLFKENCLREWFKVAGAG